MSIYDIILLYRFIGKLIFRATILDDHRDQPQRCTLRSAGRLDTLLRWAPGTWLECLSFKKAEMIWKSQWYDIRYDMQFCAECHPMFVVCFTRPKFFRSGIIGISPFGDCYLPYIAVFDAGWRLKSTIFSRPSYSLMFAMRLVFLLFLPMVAAIADCKAKRS